MITTVWPRSISWLNDFKSVFISWKCKPVVGSSKIKRVDSCFSLLRKKASFTRWFSPPESVEEDCPNFIYPSPTSCNGFNRFMIRFSWLPFTSEKNSMAWLIVISSTSLMFLPLYSISSTSCLYLFPWHDSHSRTISAINCISTVMVPSPLHSSQRPPSELKEKYEGENPICLAPCCSANSFRISSNAFKYVAGLDRVDLPMGFWSTNSTEWIRSISPERREYVPGISPPSP